MTPSCRTLLLLLASTALLAPAAAQNPLVHPDTVFVSPDSLQRFYVNARMGVYLFIGTSPNPAEAQRLYSESAPQDANPMYFDGHGQHLVKHEDRLESVDVNFEVYADGRAPASSIAYENAVPTRRNDTLFFWQAPTVRLDAEDQMSGVGQIYFSLNQQPYRPYTQPLAFETPGNYRVQYYAVDRVGNVEEVKARHVTYDPHPPVTTLTRQGTFLDDILSPRAALQLTAALNARSVGPITITSIRYQIDGGSEQTYRTPIDADDLSEGEHTITYYATNFLGVSETPQSFTFFVDKSPPRLSSEILNNQFLASNGQTYVSGRSRIKLIAFDNKIGLDKIFYSVNDADYAEYDQPFYLTASGLTSVRFYAVDRLGNSSRNDADRNSNITIPHLDLKGPDLRFDYNGNTFTLRDTVFINPRTEVRLFASDEESGVERIGYRLDGDVEAVYSGPLTLGEEGPHTLEYYGYDQVANRNVDRLFFHVDASGPEVLHEFGIPATGTQQMVGTAVNVYPSHVVLFLSAIDRLVGYDRMFYRVGDGPERQYTAPLGSFPAGSEITVTVRALDQLGNETTETIRFATAP